MWKLLPIVIFALVFAGLTEYFSISRIDANGMKVYEKKANIYYYIMAIAMAVFVGLRLYYNDTGLYVKGYEAIKVYNSLTETLFKGYKFDWGSSFGFELASRMIKYCHFSKSSFLMIFSLFTIFTNLWFIKKYSEDIFLSVFYYITMGSFTFAMAAMRQCAAIAFCLFAVDFIIRKKYFRFVLFVLIGISMHQFAFVFFAVPLLVFKPWTNRTFIFLASGIILSIFMKPLLGTITEFASSYRGGYDSNAFSGEGVNIFRVLVSWVPLVLSFIVKDKIRDNRGQNIIINLSMLNAVIMFLGLFGTANYFARLANYFLVFQTISLPIILRYFDKERQYLTVGSIIGFSAYFAYANIFAQGGFDANFFGISLWRYLGNIFE